MTGPAQYATIAGRWKHHVAASGIDKTLPRKEQALAMLMFYAGFSAALDATTELAAFDEAEAVQILQALHTEVKQVEAMATRLLTGGKLS
jgi:hypothetical protein